ncbi:MAG: sulfatase [Chthoniobacterales bacterium]|jgi:arylsulfatase A-like enzyme
MKLVHSSLVALSALLHTGFAASPPSPEQPNIIVFLVDDMGLMDTSVPMLVDASGKPKRHPLNDWYRTPSMERLAASGIRFSQFYAQSVCSPTRTSLLTGQNATRHRVTNYIAPSQNNAGPHGPSNWRWEGLGKGDTTLPAILRSAGYRTIHIGKAHFGPKGSEGADPTNIGFDINIAGDCWGQPKSYFSENHFGNHPKYANPTHNIPHLEKYYGRGTFLTEALTREAANQIEQSVKDGKPFYLNLAHYAVHAPFQADPRFESHYADSEKPLPARAFATLIEGIDKSLGDILDELERLDIAENTLIIFLGDNGTDAPLGGEHAVACSAPLRGKKGSHYEGGMRIPFVAAWAKPDPANPLQSRFPITPNTIQTQLGTVMDVFPTVLDAAKVSSPPAHALDGSSLRTLLTAKKDPSRKQVFLMHYPHSHRSSYFTSYRSGDWKLIYHYHPDKSAKPTHELFNLAEDPSEQNNLAAAHPEKVTAMIQAMARQLEDEGALYPEDKDQRALKPRAPAP